MTTVFVTGADRGLGLGFVKVSLDKGYKVFAGHFFDNSNELFNIQSKYKEHLYLVKLDISSDESVNQAAQYIKEQTEYIDLLINNAGILGDIDHTIFQDLDFKEILEVININAIGPLRVIKAMLALVLKSPAKTIVNISSEAGSIGQNHREAWFGYCMSKAALNMGGALVHKSIIEQGGRVLQIHPGWIKSYMHGYLNDKAEFEPEQAASKIFDQIIEQLKSPIGELPVFIDLNGEKMLW
jgi:NAD(P)-dependent dehydrogenase (short-subunit alcohol dehydrogenase family)